jgi:hypothetical protein
VDPVEGRVQAVTEEVRALLRSHLVDQGVHCFSVELSANLECSFLLFNLPHHYVWEERIKPGSARAGFFHARGFVQAGATGR